jgi:carboxypeptidase Taq
MLMTDASLEIYERVCAYSRETALFESIESLLAWDERTLIPPAAGEYRAEQITCLAALLHRRRVDPQLGEWLNALAESALAEDPHSDTGATIRHLLRDYYKHTRLPARLVEELTRTAVLGQQAWVEARRQDDFGALQPLLEKMVTLKREQAEAIGYTHNRYDALLDDFEQGATTPIITQVLEGLRQELVPFVAEITAAQRRPPSALLHRHFPQAAQEDLARRVAQRIGFDFQRGRLDVTYHPFCSAIGPQDCRITTRYDEQYFSTAFFGTLHEAGHGLYDQGLRVDQYGLPPGMYCSLGIHESQSRMWENLVGRSLAFWKYFFPEVRRCFPAALDDVTLDEFYFAINGVDPSLIRVEADEATYNLHIIIRFELEQALVDGELSTHDLPAAWNEKYRQFLGITPSGAADGVLQDIHWSAGLFGYFPTYTLGNLYAAQFFEAADAAVGGLGERLAVGDFVSLGDWLREKIHKLGRCFTANELGQRVTGQPLTHEPLMRHLRAKYEHLYGLRYA